MSDLPSPLTVRKRLNDKGLNPDSFCLVPFSTIILEPDGQVGMCRHKGNNFPIGHIDQNTIWEIWNSPKARQWRREFISGELDFCKDEVKYRHCHLCPNNNKLLDDIKVSEVQENKILKLTANFNGFCNLKCQMCDIWKLPNGRYTEENFWRSAREEIFPHLKEIDMLSGEPFLQEDTFKLIKEMSVINPRCRWQITTNLHWKFTKRIKEHMDLVNFNYLLISCDSLDHDTYHKIRKPGNLSVVLKNIELILDYREQRVDKFPIMFNFLVQKDNWQEIEYAYQFCKSKNIKPFLTFLYDPSEFSILDYSEEKKCEVLEYILKLNSDIIISSLRVVRPIIDSLSKPLMKKYSFLLSEVIHPSPKIDLESYV